MGFVVQETMSGTHELESGWGAPGRQPFAFRVAWGPERLREWLDPRSPQFLWQELEGEVRLGGLDGVPEWAPCRGTLELDYFGSARIRYVFDVPAGERTFRFQGDKVELRPWNLLVTHTTCFGTLTELESGRLVSRSVTRFRLRDLPRMALSTRWRA